MKTANSDSTVIRVDINAKIIVTFSWKFPPIKWGKKITWAKIVTDNALQALKTITVNVTFRNKSWEFPGGPVVRTPRFHCWGCGFSPWLGNWDPTSQAVQCGQKKRNKSPNSDFLSMCYWSRSPLGFNEQPVFMLIINIFPSLSLRSELALSSYHC